MSSSKGKIFKLNFSCCYSDLEANYYEQRNQVLTRVDPLFEALGFPIESRGQMYDVFLKLDSSHDGLISFDEFCDYFDLEETKFAHRSFLVLDQGISGVLDFPSFILCSWNYCTYDKRGLAAFAFRLYDEAGDGRMTDGYVKKIPSQIEEDK